MSAASGTDFHMDLNLQRLAMMTLTASFWDRTHVKHEILKIFTNGKKFKNHKAHSCLKVLIRQAKNELKAWKLASPKVTSEMYDRFLQIVISFGLRIIHWYDYLCLNVFFDLLFTGALHWTVYGTIDQGKIVEDWLERFHTSGDGEEKNFWEANRSMLYYMASSCALEDYINLNAEEIVRFCLTYEGKCGHPITIDDYANLKRIDYILCAVLTLANTETIQNYIPLEKREELLRKYFDNLTTSKEASMFPLAVKEGHRAAVQYYWHHLNPINHEKMILTSVFNCIKELDLANSESDLNRCDILVFLLLKMTESQKSNFFANLCEPDDRYLNSLKFIITLANSYGWEEYFFPVLEIIKGHVQLDFTLILRIMDTYVKMCKLGLDSEITVYRKIFLKAWEEVEEGDRLLFVKTNSPKLFKVFDINILNTTFNGVQLEDEERKSLLLTGTEKYEKLIGNNQFDLLDTFVKTILKSEDERKWFKKRLQLFDYFILYGRFDVVDNLLHWHSCSVEERKTLKHGIDILSLCARNFRQNDFSSADEISNWAFSNAEEKTEYINNLEAEELNFLSEIFYKNRNIFISTLSKFLNWFFDDEAEVTKFKTEKIASEQSLLNFFKELNKRPEEIGTYRCLVGRDALTTLDNLIKFCLSPESINKLKLQISQNIGDWLLFLAVKHCWGQSDNFLNWILGYQTAFEKEERILNYKDKQELVKKFLLSPKGMELFKRILLSDHYNTFNKKYFGLWIKWSEDIEKIENYIDELATSIPDKTNDINKNFEDFKNMLLDLKTNEEDPSGNMEHVCFRKLQTPLPTDF